jgi:hypothetical protein
MLYKHKAGMSRVESRIESIELWIHAAAAAFTRLALEHINVMEKNL